MNVTAQNVLIVIAVICFVLVAMGVSVGGAALLPIGLALFAGAHLS